MGSTCYTCNATYARFKCGGCEETVYCDRGCQKIDWPRHKLECMPLGPHHKLKCMPLDGPRHKPTCIPRWDAEVEAEVQTLDKSSTCPCCYQALNAHKEGCHVVPMGMGSRLCVTLIQGVIDGYVGAGTETLSLPLPEGVCLVTFGLGGCSCVISRTETAITMSHQYNKVSIDLPPGTTHAMVISPGDWVKTDKWEMVPKDLAYWENRLEGIEVVWYPYSKRITTSGPQCACVYMKEGVIMFRDSSRTLPLWPL